MLKNIFDYRGKRAVVWQQTKGFNIFADQIRDMQQSDIIIRKASTADAALIADLSRETFLESFGPVNTPENMEKFMSGPFSRQVLMAETADADNLFLLAVQNGAPAGYVKLRHSLHTAEMPRENAIELARIYVSQRVTSRGIGTQLMQAALDEARRLKKEVIWLGVWEHNHRAIEFYARWGFERFGEHPFMLGDDRQTDLLYQRLVP